MQKGHVDFQNRDPFPIFQVQPNENAITFPLGWCKQCKGLAMTSKVLETHNLKHPSGMAPFATNPH